MSERVGMWLTIALAVLTLVGATSGAILWMFDITRKAADLRQDLSHVERTNTNMCRWAHTRPNSGNLDCR